LQEIYKQEYSLQKKPTIGVIHKKKGVEKLSMITAYDSLFAKLFNGIVDMILVGDSLNMSFRGEGDTLSATVDVMVYHTKAVCNGATDSFIVADMPFGTYTTKESAFENASKFYRETCADAVKIEGGEEREEIISHLVENGIAVMGHIGLTPQSFRGEGGYFVKGKDEDSRIRIVKDALAVERAGAFALVIEGTKSDLAKEIADRVSIPVIGIGAGAEVDGQVLVWSDMLGFFEDFKPKFVKRYMNGGEIVKEAVQKYVKEVKSGEFPEKEHIY
jgi:3-methyl-2-oxobutanoate hydroxymethyltransferase